MYLGILMKLHTLYRIRSILHLLLITGTFCSISYAQVNRALNYPQFIEKEVPNDPYLPIPLNNRITSPAYHFSTPRISTRQVNVDDAGLNIIGDAANEPSMAIDQKNPNRIMIGWRQFDSQLSDFRQAGFGYSPDGGATWKMNNPIDAGNFRSDPVLDSDSDGAIFYNSLSLNFECTVYKSTDQDKWDSGTYAYGGDKQWMAIDKYNKQGNNNIYASWSLNPNTCDQADFTRSIDKGRSYQKCISIPNFPTRGTITTGINGEVYVCGQYNGFTFSRSSNAGHANQNIVWDFSRQIDLDGGLIYYTGPNPRGLLGQPWIATDLSNGPNKGNVYILSTVFRVSKNDDADVMFTRSRDGGLSWSKPIQINDDSLEANWNWFGTMSVAPNGRIDVIWLDTRHDPGGVNSKLYYSQSLNGGVSWSKNEAVSPSFNPHLGWPNQMKMGDYFHMISDNSGAHLAWSATFNGEQDIYYSFIHADTLTNVRNFKNSDYSIATLSQNRPNPFSIVTTVNYQLKKLAYVTIDILDLSLTKSIKVIVQENKLPGDYVTSWNGTNSAGAEVPNGIYFFRFMIKGEPILYQKMILMR